MGFSSTGRGWLTGLGKSLFWSLFPALDLSRVRLFIGLSSGAGAAAGEPGNGMGVGPRDAGPGDIARKPAPGFGDGAGRDGVKVGLGGPRASMGNDGTGAGDQVVEEEMSGETKGDGAADPASEGTLGGSGSVAVELSAGAVGAGGEGVNAVSETWLELRVCVA
jgi:hypothetical protein